MKVAIIPGHGWRGRNRFDPGAVHGGIREADVVRSIATECARLSPSQVTVHDSVEAGPWTYRKRREAAHAAIGDGPGVVLHLHVNAGGGTYLMAMHDPRSTTGKGFADEWQGEARRLARSLGGKSIVRAAVRADWKHAANLIEPSYSATPAGVAAVLLEVGFIDHPQHDSLWTRDGINTLAQTIVSAYAAE